MDFLQLNEKTILVFGVANRKSVAWFIAKTLEEEGAKVVYSVRSEARKETTAKLLKDKPVYICDVETKEEIDRLAEEISKDFEYVATGHGPMGTLENVTEWRQYFEALEAAVAGGIEAGQSLEQMMETIELPQYRDWVSYDAWLPLNVRGMYHFLTD